MIRRLLIALALSAAAQAQTEGDFTIRDFHFRSGETLPELRMHYTTLGTPHRGGDGKIDNAVMVLHGTGGSGKQFLQPQFAGELFGPDQPLDTRKFYVILPDNIGHGKSSKPSDGMRMRFPAYDYDDMVEAQRRLLVEALGVMKLRLLMGTSMGCMHGFVWAEMHPRFAQAHMPLACLPVQIAGQNRMWRTLARDAITKDPAWKDGAYTAQPVQGLRTAVSLLTVAGGAPLFLQKSYPARDAADSYVRDRVEKDIATRDANDLLYQLDSSRTYDPSPGLEKITAPMTWINSEDDFINPSNLPIAGQAMKRLKSTRFVLIPESDTTRGHGTHTWVTHWKAELVDLLRRSE